MNDLATRDTYQEWDRLQVEAVLENLGPDVMAINGWMGWFRDITTPQGDVFGQYAIRYESPPPDVPECSVSRVGVVDITFRFPSDEEIEDQVEAVLPALRSAFRSARTARFYPYPDAPLQRANATDKKVRKWIEIRFNGE